MVGGIQATGDTVLPRIRESLTWGRCSRWLGDYDIPCIWLPWTNAERQRTIAVRKLFPESLLVHFPWDKQQSREALISSGRPVPPGSN